MKGRNKSGLLPALYSQLTNDEKADVKANMTIYNATSLDKPYFEPEQFYQQVYKGVTKINFSSKRWV